MRAALYIAAVATTVSIGLVGCGSKESSAPAEPAIASSASVADHLMDVESTVFSQVGYNASAQELTVVFRDGGETYVYKGIAPEMYQSLVGASSMGTYYHENIRDKFEYDRN